MRDDEKTDDLFSEINTKNLKEFLLFKGWKVYNQKREDISVFQKEQDGSFLQITVPNAKELSDYLSALKKCISSLSENLNETIESVLLQVANVTSDIIKIRIENSRIRTGNASLEDFSLIGERARQMIRTTTLSEMVNVQKDTKVSHESINDFVRSCEIGQTEIGSYVIPIILPIYSKISPEEIQLSIFPSLSPGRLIATKFIKDVFSVYEAINSPKTEKEIALEFKNKNILSGFCEALSEIIPENQNDHTIEFISRWSPLLPNEETIPTTITFHSITHKKRFSKISKILGETETTNKKIVGLITKLKADPEISKREGGTAYISFLDETGNARLLAVVLKVEDYNKALEAHERGRQVVVTGTIHQKKKGGTIEYSSFDELQY